MKRIVDNLKYLLDQVKNNPEDANNRFLLRAELDYFLSQIESIEKDFTLVFEQEKIILQNKNALLKKQQKKLTNRNQQLLIQQKRLEGKAEEFRKIILENKLFRYQLDSLKKQSVVSQVKAKKSRLFDW